MITYREAYEAQFKIWKEAEADLQDVIDFMINHYKETSDQKIGEFLRKRGVRL